MKLSEILKFTIFAIVLFVLLSEVNLFSWREFSVLALTKSIIDCNSLTIDCYYNITGDRSYYNGHYYTDKAPGTSFILTPIYLIIKNHLSGLYYGGYSYIFFIFFSSVLPSATSIILIYKILKSYKNIEFSEMLPILIAAVFGTLLLPYSTVMFGYAIPVLIMLVIVRIFYSYFLCEPNSYMRRSYDKTNIFTLFGTLLGIIILFDYVFVVVYSLIPLFVYLMLKTKRFYLLFIVVIGFFVGMLPMIIYNYTNFGHVYSFSFMNLDAEHQWISGIHSYLNHVFETRKYYITNLYQSMLSPYRGLLYYSPVLIFSIHGLWLMMNKKIEKDLLYSLFTITMLFLMVILISTYFVWFGGTSFGMRYFFPIMIALFLPLYVSYLNIRKNVILLSVFYFTLLISMTNMFLAFFNEWEGVSFKINDGVPIYAHIPWKGTTIRLDEYSKIDVLLNYYYNGFVSGKIRSSILARYIIDFLVKKLVETYDVVSYRNYILIELFWKILLVVPKSVILIFLILVSFSVYLHSYRKYFLLFILLIIAIVFAHTRIFTLKSPIIIFGNGWYPEEKNGRWMGNHSEIYIFTPSKGIYNISFCVDIFPSNMKRTISVYGRDEVNLYSVYTGECISIPLTIEKNPKKLLFISLDGCSIPRELYIDNNDDRCLSFFFRNITLDYIGHV